MPITVTSACGKSFALKDEMAGRLVKCPECGEELRVPGGASPSAPAFDNLDPVFMRKKFLLRQKHLAISEKYAVWDEGGKSILFIQRPAMLLRGCLAVLAGVAVALVVGGGSVAVGIGMDSTPGGVIAAVGCFAAIVAALVVAVAVSAKRHVFFYRDETLRELLLKIEQDQKVALFVATYTVKDEKGQVIARLRKNYIYNVFRKRWYVFKPDGRLLSVVKEDSLILSLLRRLLGSFFGLLRANFIFLKGDGEEVVGEFNRAFTLLDRYVLDMSADTSDHIDPRIALATGVMLDTGERR